MAKSGAAAQRKLATYRKKRDFARTPEPSGARGARTQVGRSFVVQKHAARRLHYDFRLELDGVLLSWAVPKGPSLAPGDRRLAVRTEDHPLAYADFEGIIPAGQYGGGTVVVWDQGSWEPVGDPDAGLAKGHLEFELHGHKLHGRWNLVRTKLSDGKAENWLLIKAKDDAASERDDVVARAPKSVLSGRTIEQVAKAPKRVWTSNRSGGDADGAAPAPAAAPAAGDDELAQLIAALPIHVALSNLDRVLYPEAGITKGMLIGYLAVVADHLLPHVVNRPLTLVRCPTGHRKQCFYQKHAGLGTPAQIQRIRIRDGGGDDEYLYIRDLDGLIATAQLGTLELHTWGCRIDDVEHPDRLVFDLDPDVGMPWARVVTAAEELRARLGDADLDSFVKTTGGKGLHVVVPIDRRVDWDEAKAFCRAFAEAHALDHPGAYTTNPLKARRKGKIFIDYLRNGRGATFIAPYAPRARDGAPVAMPVTWEELATVEPASFTLATVPGVLAKRRTDPWAALAKTRQSITAAAWRQVGGKPK